MTSSIAIQFVLLTLVGVLTVAVGHHCNKEYDPCDADGLFPEKRTVTLVQKISHCDVPAACDNSTSGTGHKLYSEADTDQLVAVERCYSFCFWNVRTYVGKALRWR